MTCNIILSLRITILSEKFPLHLYVWFFWNWPPWQCCSHIFMSFHLSTVLATPCASAIVINNVEFSSFMKGWELSGYPTCYAVTLPKSPHYLYVIFKISSPKAATTSFYSQYLAYISRISASFSLPIESQNPDNSHTISTQQNIELAELLLENRNSVNSWKLFCSNITRERLTSLSYKQKILGLFAQLSPIIYSGIFFLQGFRWFLCLNSI